MKVSIITISYNSESTIIDTIESVVNQDYQDIEYIVVDGESTDSTPEIIGRYRNDITTSIIEKDRGRYDAMNKGVSAATGDIVGLIHSNDMLNSDDCISELVKKMQQTNADVVYGNKIYVHNKDSSKVVRYFNPGEFDRNRYRKGWMTPHLSTYIKTDMYRKLGLYRTDMKIAADYELMLRFIYKHGAKTVYLNKTIAKMRAGGISNSSLKNYIISSYESYISWKLNGLSISPMIMIRKPISKLFQFFLPERSANREQ